MAFRCCKEKELDLKSEALYTSGLKSTKKRNFSVAKKSIFSCFLSSLVVAYLFSLILSFLLIICCSSLRVGANIVHIFYFFSCFFLLWQCISYEDERSRYLSILISQKKDKEWVFAVVKKELDLKSEALYSSGLKSTKKRNFSVAKKLFIKILQADQNAGFDMFNSLGNVHYK